MCCILILVLMNSDNFLKDRDIKTPRNNYLIKSEHPSEHPNRIKNMAIDSKDYPNKIKANLWANKNYTIYFYNFMENRKRYRGLIDLSSKTSWSKRDKISVAEAELIKI